VLRQLSALLPFGRYAVEGDSMTPAVGSGERVLVNRLAYWLREPKRGDLVVVRDPRDTARLLLKRIDREADGGWLVLGDNPAASTDSRTFGPVDKSLIVGKVWGTY